MIEARTLKIEGADRGCVITITRTDTTKELMPSRSKTYRGVTDPSLRRVENLIYCVTPHYLFLHQWGVTVRFNFERQ